MCRSILKIFLGGIVSICLSAIAHGEMNAEDTQAWGPEIFPRNYADSRQKFRELCTGMRNSSPEIKCLSYTLDPSEDLTIDSLWSPSESSEKVLILVSGVHGAEASTGAAIQFQFVMSHLPLFTEKGISVLLIHALNPWGFLHQRRVTATNVDLNRNFPSREDAQWTPNQGYMKLRPWLEPQDLTHTGFWPFSKFAMGLLWKVATFQFSIDEMNQAVAGGQRESAKGLFYGGLSPEPQIRYLQDLLDNYLKKSKEAVMIDLHTGLGNAGVLHLMPSDRPSTSGADLRTRLFENPTQAVYEITTEKTDGFYQVSGDFLDFAEERGPESLAIAAMTMEFGTRGTGILAQLKSLFTMIAENQSYQDRENKPWTEDQRTKAQDDFDDLFAPKSDKWRREVLSKSTAFFNQLLQRF